MSTSNVVIPSISLTKLFDASSRTASLVPSILQAANRLFVSEPVGNTFAIPSDILQTSTDTARPAPRRWDVITITSNYDISH
ncbi:hypothetical protein EDD85DRAFT_951710 [Armillaria nabsnona]|nr:hypothetical protein EDD85DRAFT_951710 [Armillaria nabsnona]